MALVAEGRTDPAALALRRSLALLAVITLITAYFSLTYYGIDEHFQVLEFVSYKLGITQPADLPWEFGAQARSWMQPATYYLVGVALRRVGVSDLFAVSFTLRLVTGIGGVVALVAFARAFSATLQTGNERLAYARSLPAFGFLPYLFVRTSSEAASLALFSAGFALVMHGRQSATPVRLTVAGLLAGLAFECRYQTVILILGIGAWLLIVARLRGRELVLLGTAAALPVLFGVVIDHWGYGQWCFPAWNYFRANIIEGVANNYGTKPFFAYAYLTATNIFLPIVAVLEISMIVAWVRRPWHAVTWTAVRFGPFADRP